MYLDLRLRAARRLPVRLPCSPVTCRICLCLSLNDHNGLQEFGVAHECCEERLLEVLIVLSGFLCCRIGIIEETLRERRLRVNGVSQLVPTTAHTSRCG